MEGTKMKKITLFAAVISVAGLLVAGNVLAATSADLTVSATVVDACAITGGAIDFGNLDPIAGGAVTADSTGVTVACTSGDTYTITDDKAGSYSLSDGSGNNIAYSLTYPAVPAADGTAKGYTITGDIADGAYASSPAGAYSDTVVLTVNP